MYDKGIMKLRYYIKIAFAVIFVVCPSASLVADQYSRSKDFEKKFFSVNSSFFIQNP